MDAALVGVQLPTRRRPGCRSCRRWWSVRLEGARRGQDADHRRRSQGVARDRVAPLSEQARTVLRTSRAAQILVDGYETAPADCHSLSEELEAILSRSELFMIEQPPSPPSFFGPCPPTSAAPSSGPPEVHEVAGSSHRRMTDRAARRGELKPEDSSEVATCLCCSGVCPSWDSPRRRGNRHPRVPTPSLRHTSVYITVDTLTSELVEIHGERRTGDPKNIDGPSPSPPMTDGERSAASTDRSQRSNKGTTWIRSDAARLDQPSNERLTEPITATTPSGVARRKGC